MTYPNVLVLDYLKNTRQATREIKLKAEKYVAAGYQRMLTFQAEDGGFSLFGDSSGDILMSAYSLMHLSDMARVYPVDERIIKQTAQWLINQQHPDGSWRIRDYWPGSATAWATPYVAWALAEAGYENTYQVALATEYIQKHALQEKDPYILALTANALAAYNPKGRAAQQVLERLDSLKKQDGDTFYWQAGNGTFMGGAGTVAKIETTALAAYAFMKADKHMESVNGAISFLVRARDSYGTWHTTQATILALRTLLLTSTRAGQADKPAVVRVSLNHEHGKTIFIDKSNSDIVHFVTFDKGFSSAGNNQVQIDVQGGGNLMYQATVAYYLPWPQTPSGPETGELIDISLDYDRTSLSVNDTVTANVEIRLRQKRTVKMVLADLGVPPGFTVFGEDLSYLVEQGLIQRYELTGRQIIIYLENFSDNKPLRFSYRLRACLPIRAKTPPSSVYDYYNPDKKNIQEPLQMVVRQTNTQLQISR